MFVNCIFVHVSIHAPAAKWLLHKYSQYCTSSTKNMEESIVYVSLNFFLWYVTLIILITQTFSSILHICVGVCPSFFVFSFPSSPKNFHSSSFPILSFLLTPGQIRKVNSHEFISKGSVLEKAR